MIVSMLTALLETPKLAVMASQLQQLLDEITVEPTWLHAGEIVEVVKAVWRVVCFMAGHRIMMRRRRRCRASSRLGPPRRSGPVKQKRRRAAAPAPDGGRRGGPARRAPRTRPESRGPRTFRAARMEARPRRGGGGGRRRCTGGSSRRPRRAGGARREAEAGSQRCGAPPAAFSAGAPQPARPLRPGHAPQPPARAGRALGAGARLAAKSRLAARRSAAGRPSGPIAPGRPRSPSPRHPCLPSPPPLLPPQPLGQGRMRLRLDLNARVQAAPVTVARTPFTVRLWLDLNARVQAAPVKIKVVLTDEGYRDMDMALPGLSLLAIMGDTDGARLKISVACQTRPRSRLCSTTRGQRGARKLLIRSYRFTCKRLYATWSPSPAMRIRCLIAGGRNSGHGGAAPVRRSNGAAIMRGRSLDLREAEHVPGGGPADRADSGGRVGLDGGDRR